MGQQEGTASLGNQGRISLDELRQTVTRISARMTAYVESVDAEPDQARLPNLTALLGLMGTAFPQRPPYNARHAAQWDGFAAGERKELDRTAVRYLCWQPEIAISPKFLAYLWGSGMKMGVRSLAGLVRSCHTAWGIAEGRSSTGVIKDLILRYEGPSPIILKWKTDSNALFGARGPSILAERFVGSGVTLNVFFGEWYLDPESPFSREVVAKASAVCREQFGEASPDLLRLLFGELLSWPGWDLSALRREIGSLILVAASAQARQTLQRFLLIPKVLGDPRMPENEGNWAEMAPEAKSRVLGWLSENPFALQERVYRQGQGWIWQKAGQQYKVAHFETE
jgi:hypothetical protein